MAQKDSPDEPGPDDEGVPRTAPGAPAGDRVPEAPPSAPVPECAPEAAEPGREATGPPLPQSAPDADAGGATEEPPAAYPGPDAPADPEPLAQTGRHEAVPAEETAIANALEPEPEQADAPTESADDVLHAATTPLAPADAEEAADDALPDASGRAASLAPESEPADAPSPPAPRREEDARPLPLDRKREALRIARSAFRYAVYGVAGYIAFVLLLMIVYRFVNPPASTLMLFRWLGGATIEQTWVPIGHMSPHLVRATIVAEDSRFCQHWGIDLKAVEDAIERATDGTIRGASTISMQLTKNMFLWPWKSYLRKMLEVPLTLALEVVWPKRRILETYLNVAEWGPGVFGAEAASRHHFKKPAAKLSEREAALLAASLPNPFRRVAGKPGPRTARKARIIQARMHAAKNVASCVLDTAG